jgi:hypothetical protein
MRLNTAGSLPQSGEPEPRRPAPPRARAWQAAGYFLSGPTQPPALKPSSPAGSWMTQRDVLAHDDLSHFGSAPRCSSGNQTLAARPASPPCLAEQPASFADPPGSRCSSLDKRRIRRRCVAAQGTLAGFRRSFHGAEE